MYDAKNPTAFTLADCEKAVGKRATVALTGTIVEAREGPAGPYVMFQIDGRWGFGNPIGQPYKLGIDLDALNTEDAT
jgi:hypothetical protein